MYCWKCGSQIPERSEYCNHCGAKTKTSGGEKNETGKRDIRAYVAIGVVILLILLAGTILIGMLSNGDTQFAISYVERANTDVVETEAPTPSETPVITPPPTPATGAEAAAERFTPPEQYATENDLNWPATEPEDYVREGKDAEERKSRDLSTALIDWYSGEMTTIHATILKTVYSWDPYALYAVYYITPYLDARAEGMSDVEAHLIALQETDIDRQMLGREEYTALVYDTAVEAGASEYMAEEFALWEGWIWGYSWEIYRDTRDSGSNHEKAIGSVDWGCFVNTPTDRIPNRASRQSEHYENGLTYDEVEGLKEELFRLLEYWYETDMWD